MFSLHKYVKPLLVDLNDQRHRFLAEHERHFGQRNRQCRSPNAFLFVIHNQLTTPFSLTGIEMKQNGLKVIVVGRCNVDAESL